MDDGVIPLTRAEFTRIEITDGLVVVTRRSGTATLRHATPIADFLREWRMAGQAIADWEDAQRPAEIVALPARPRRKRR